MQYVVSFLVLQKFSKGYRTVFFILIVFLLSAVAVSVLCRFLMVPWVGPWSVIVPFPGHARLLFIFYARQLA